MKASIFHWILVLLLSSWIPVDLVALQSHAEFAADQNFSSFERQDESFKSLASHKRTARGQKTKLRYGPI